MLTPEEAHEARSTQAPMIYERTPGRPHRVIVIAVAEFGVDSYAVRIEDNRGDTLWVNEGQHISPAPSTWH